MEIWSLFSGGFGLDLGLESAGYKTTLAVELDRHCCQTIAANRPSIQVLQRDVSGLTAAELRRERGYRGDVDLLVGGPPCQSFSSGGKRAALSDPRGNLIYQFLRLVSEIRPKTFVFENVGNIVTAALRHRAIKDRPGKHWSLKKYSDGEQGGLGSLDPDEQAGSAIGQILSDVGKLGYRITFSVVDAAEYGAAQHRLRFVMFAARDAEPPVMMTATHGTERRPFRTLRDAIADLTADPGPGSLYSPGTQQYFDLVPPGGNWRDLPEHVKPLAMGGSFLSGGGKTGFYRRLSWDHPSPTITGKANRKGTALCHPGETRPLSVRECARVQGFPDDWTFVGAANQQYQQIGNAVPVALGRAIGLSLKRASGTAFQKKRAVRDEHGMLEAALAKLRSYGRNKRSRRMIETDEDNDAASGVRRRA
jgi:DNA (cytosine-5)-methyltransferase 1